MAQKQKIPFSKKGKREISRFIGHELLYDYLSGNLDKERRDAIEDHIKFSRDAQLDLAKIQAGQNYADKLSATIVLPPVIDRISTPGSYFSVLMQKTNFDKWPQGLKWGLEALVVVFGIVTVLTITPWQKVMDLDIGKGSKEVILAEVSKTYTLQKIEDKPEFIDEGVKEATPVAPEANKQPAVAKNEVSDSTAPAKVEPIEKTAEVQQQANTATTANNAITGGFLYRGKIDVKNIDVVGSKITEKIAELGGRKAGSVELGWHKTPESMYYHFTIPEAKYQDLLAFLSTYGTPKIGKEKHSRIMPDGIIRLILSVDEDKK